MPAASPARGDTRSLRRDLVHVATCIHEGIGEIVSADHGFDGSPRSAESTRPSSGPSPRRLAPMTTVRPALDAALRHTIALRTEALFRSSGRFREGHFLLKSGRHGDAYVEKFQVLQDPAATSELCGFFATHGRGGDGETLVDLVAGPTTGGVILAFETARQLGVRSIFAEEVRGDDGTLRREFRRGFRIEPGEQVLLVDDILTTGGSLLAMLPAVEAMGGEIVECVVLVDRSGGRATPHLAGDRSRLPAARALAARPADLRARSRRPARAAPTGRRSTPRAAPGPAPSAAPAAPAEARADRRWILAPGTCSSSPSSPSSR